MCWQMKDEGNKYKIMTIWFVHVLQVFSGYILRIKDVYKENAKKM